MKILKTLILACTLLICTPIFANPEVAGNTENGGKGTVAETMTAAGYVYIRLAEDDIWIAASQAEVEVGDKIQYTGGSTMKDFNSRTLNRKFDYIFFVMNLEVFKAVEAEKHSVASGDDPHGIDKSVVAVEPKAGEIATLEGGKTIAQIRTDADKLKGQKVALRGRVMKVSMNIVGKNWITLQDGTGSAPDNKLIATSTEVANIGDLVTVTGVVNTNVDLGSGYNYAVLIQEATFSN